MNDSFHIHIEKHKFRCWFCVTYWHNVPQNFYWSISCYVTLNLNYLCWVQKVLVKSWFCIGKINLKNKYIFLRRNTFCVDKMVFKLRHFNWILELNFRENKTINQAQIGTGKPKICCGFAHKRIDLKKKTFEENVFLIVFVFFLCFFVVVVWWL